MVRLLAKWSRWTIAGIMSFALFSGVGMVAYWLVSGFAAWAGIESKNFLVWGTMLVGLPLLMGLGFWMMRNPVMQRFDAWLTRE